MKEFQYQNRIEKIQSREHPRIMGIDPSLTGTGIVYLRDGKIEDKMLIKTKPTGDNKVEELRRLMYIKSNFPTAKIDLALIEGMAFMAHNTTALVQLAALNYFIRERLYLDNVPFIVVAPTSLKKFITGKGNSKKDEIMMEVYKRFGVTMTDDNLCDAYSLAKLGCMMTDPNEKPTKFQKEVIELLKPQLKPYEKIS